MLDYDLTAKTYNKQAQGITVAAKNGIIGLGTITVKYYEETTVPTNAGTYKVTVDIAQGTNYEATTIELGNYTINKANVTVDIDDQESIFGEPLVTDLTYTVNGTVYEGDDLNIVITKAPGTDVNTYAITGSYNNDNYNVTFNDGTYTIRANTINDSDVEIVNPTELVYDNSAKEVTVNVDSTKVEYTLTYEEKDGTDYKAITGSPVDAGTYRAKVVANGIGNFSGDVTVYSADFTITQATPEYVVPTGLTATYGDKLSSVKLTTGFTFENMTADTTVGDAGINNFTVKYTPVDTKNYKTITNIPVTIDVAKASEYKLPDT